MTAWSKARRRRRLQSVDDYRRAANRRLPRFIADFIDGGAEAELTVAQNERSFDDLALRPAILTGVGADPDTTVEVAGQRLSLPLLTAPTGSSRIAGLAGELGAVRAVDATGTVAVVSNGTTVPLDQLVAATGTPPWLQMMFFRDRDWTAALLERAGRLGVPAIVATADTPVIGHRVRDAHHGLKLPIRPRLRWMPTIARHPRWLAETLVSPPITSRGFAELGPGLPLRRAIDGMFNADQDWAYLEWIRERWPGKLLVKGVMRAEDAERAVDIGCEGVIVSNHGGRQLDGVPSSLEALPEIAAAVGSRADVLLDGGVRRGTDLIKATALGARACLIGRPWLWGLRAGGTEGVIGVIETLHTELRRAMILLGVASLEDVGPDLLLRRPGSGWERLAPTPERPQG